MADRSDGRSSVERYGRIYKAFLDAEVPLLALKNGEKRPIHRVRDSLVRSLDEIEEVMDWHGCNLGAVTHSKFLRGANPHGFVNLDIDKPGDPLDLSRFRHMVRRHGETQRGQYWFRLPNPAEPFKAFYGGKKGLGYDLATWNVVLPGSYKGTDSLYELWVRDGGDWTLWEGQPFDIGLLPVIDLKDFLPRVPPATIQAPSKAELVLAEKPVPIPLVKRESKPRTGKPLKAMWVSATGTERTLKSKASWYLRNCALPSIAGWGGHTALFVVVVNLRLYFKRSLPQTIALIRNHYDHRCLTAQGEPYPWSDEAIRHKFDQAGKEGVCPTLGIADPKAKKKAVALSLQEEVKRFLGAYTSPGGSVSPSALRDAFIAQRGGEDVKANALGRALTACGLKTTNPGGKRTYVGIHIPEAESGLTRVGEIGRDERSGTAA